jgi:hypothetical protein
MDITIGQLARDLALAGYSKSTQEQYVAIVTRLGPRLGKPIAAWTREDVRGTAEWLSAPQFSPPSPGGFGPTWAPRGRAPHLGNVGETGLVGLDHLGKVGSDGSARPRDDEPGES